MSLATLGARLRERRKALGMSQAEVGKAIGWHQVELSELETGKKEHVRADVLARIGALYGIEPNDWAEYAGWWVGHNAPDGDPYWELLGEVLSGLETAHRETVLRQCVALAKAERLAEMSRRSDQQLGREGR